MANKTDLSWIPRRREEALEVLTIIKFKEGVIFHLLVPTGRGLGAGVGVGKVAQLILTTINIPFDNSPKYEVVSSPDGLRLHVIGEKEGATCVITGTITDIKKLLVIMGNIAM